MYLNRPAMKRFLLMIALWFVVTDVLAQVGPPTRYILKYRIESPQYTYWDMKWYNNNNQIVTQAGETTPNETTLIWEREVYLTYAIGNMDVRFSQSKQVYTGATGGYVWCSRELRGQWDMPGGVNYIVDDLQLNDNSGPPPSACWSEPFTQPRVDMRFIPAILIGNKDRSDPANNAYCDNQVVRLAVTYHGAIGDYGMENYTGWQYRVDNGDFHPIVVDHVNYTLEDWDHGLTGLEASFTLRDMFGADYPNYLNKRIEFRAAAGQRYIYVDPDDDTELRPMSKPDEGSNVLAYYFYRSTPEPTATAAVTPLCANGTSNALNVTFDRGLLSGEQITAVSLFKKENGIWGAYYQMQSAITALGPGNTFSWTNIQRPLEAGEYYMNIEGIISGQPTCNSSNYFFNVTAPPPVTFNITDRKDVSCYGGADGRITITGAGGVGGYSYSIDNGATWRNAGNVFSGLAKGTYNVLVRDQNGCNAAAAQTATINEPAAALDVTIDGVTDPRGATTNDGTIRIAVSGGTSPYTYSWSNGAVTQNISGLGNGTYTVTVTDAHGCTASKNIPVVAPAPLLLSITEIPVSCYGILDGGLRPTVSGGVRPYAYSWSNGSTTADISGLGAAIYTLEVTDANGIKISGQHELKEPASLGVTAAATAARCSGSADGSIGTSVNGGTVPYSYSWNNGATSPNATQLLAGSYRVWVTDAHGCTATAIATVNAPASLAIDGIIDPPNRYGGTDGAIVTDITGGTIPYTYSWNTGAATKDLSGLSAGDYTLTVTDNNGCTVSRTFPVNQPAPLTLNITVSADIACRGLFSGALTANVSGGVTPYTYSWSNGGTSADISGLGAGTYTLQVTDANGVMVNGQHTLNEPAILSVIATPTDAKCNSSTDGSISTFVSGGTAPYNYSWSTGATTPLLSQLAAGNYSVSVTDARGCRASAAAPVNSPAQLVIDGVVTPTSAFGSADGAVVTSISGGTSPYSYSWNTGAVTKDISGLIAASYTLTVTDKNGCIASRTFEVKEPGALTLNITITAAILCHGQSTGAVSAGVSGGTPPYIYNWSNGSTTANISGLAAGTYTLEVTDANGIKASGQYELKQPAALNVTAAATDVSCSGNTNGSINTSVIGGTAPYTYRWNTGAVTPNISQVAAGNYTVSVTDARGCVASAASTITSPTPLVIDGTIDRPGQNGNTSGAIVTTISGGTPPYSFSWNTGATTKDVSGLAIGNYTLTVTDRNGCTAARTFQLALVDPLTLSITMKSGVLCNGLSTGVLTANASGGLSPYSYQWSNGSTTAEITGLPAGTYQVRVTDNSGAILTASYTITEPQALQLSLTASEVGCNGEKNGSVHAAVSGGVLPYSYRWNTGATTPDLTGVNGGMYTLHVTDANGCILSGSATVMAPNALYLSAVVLPPNCKGYADGAIDINVSGGKAPYHFEWNTGAVTEDLASLPAGDYTLRMTDDAGCIVSQSYTLSDPAALQISLGADRTLCAGQSVSVDAGIPGGVLYSWSADNGFTANTATVALSEAGDYTVVVADSKGCQATDDITITTDTEGIGADFLMSTQGYTGESIIAVNISQPAPEQVQWTLPSAAKIVSQSDNLVEMTFDQPGHYEVTMTTSRGSCQAAAVRDVMIVDGVQLPDVNTQHNSLFKEIVLRPNPNNGQFYLDITAAEDITVNYRFLDIQRNRIVYEQKGQLTKDIMTSQLFNIPGLPAGIYVLMVESAKEKKALKVMIL